MKLALSFLLSFSAVFAFAASEASHGLGFTLNINKETSMSMSILIKNAKENDLRDVKACSSVKSTHTLRCLYFHTASGTVEVPLVLVDLIDEEELTADVSKIYKNGVVRKDAKESYPWGSVLTFKADSAHVFYLIPEDRTYSIRLGPLPDSLLANHDLQFSKVSWKFKD